MVTLRGDNSSPFQKYTGQKWNCTAITVKLGSRDAQKTHGNVTEKYLERTLPSLGFIDGKDFVVDQLDGTSKCERNLEL